MTRLTFTLNILARLRREKTPPLVRYCIVLALAESQEPLTAREIGRRLGDKLAVTGSLENAVTNGFVIQNPPDPYATYTLTQKGINLAADLISYEQPAAQPS